MWMLVLYAEHPGDCPDEMYLQTIAHGVLGVRAILPAGMKPEGIMAQRVEPEKGRCGCKFFHAVLYNPGPEGKGSCPEGGGDSGLKG
jgi:hypothetical protein